MTGAVNSVGAADTLSNILAALLPAHVIGGTEEIESGNQAMLSAAELAAMPEAVVGRQRASGSARAIARRLLAKMGCPGADILRLPNGAPGWPPGFIGSLAHEKLMAAAAIARSTEFGGIGIDVEAPEPLDDEVIQLVASRSEQQQFCRCPIDGKLLFSIKEAIFKAVNPADRVFLEFHDVMVDGDAMTAETRYGRMVHWRAGTWPRILTIAWW
jgi:4'-phosphopantetheinyl transferase EntD